MPFARFERTEFPYDKPLKRGQKPEYPHNDALDEKRDEYIAQAFDEVLVHQRKKVLENPAPLAVAQLIQAELLKQSGLENQVPSDPKQLEQAKDEYNIGTLIGRLYLYFQIDDHNDFEGLRKAIIDFCEKF